MLKRFFLVIVMCNITFFANATMPKGNADIGQQKAYTCQFCHGPTGYSLRDDYPHINGQNEQYLYNAMKAYQNGLRSGSFGLLMKQQMSVLNDQDLADIAAFYAIQSPGKPAN